MVLRHVALQLSCLGSNPGFVVTEYSSFGDSLTLVGPQLPYLESGLVRVSTKFMSVTKQCLAHGKSLCKRRLLLSFGGKAPNVNETALGHRGGGVMGSLLLSRSHWSQQTYDLRAKDTVLVVEFDSPVSQLVPEEEPTVGVCEFTQTATKVKRGVPGWGFLSISSGIMEHCGGRWAKDGGTGPTLRPWLSRGWWEGEV